jgi:hypothetical protein
MSLIDVLHRLEKLELLDSSDIWIDQKFKSEVQFLRKRESEIVI